MNKDDKNKKHANTEGAEKSTENVKEVGKTEDSVESVDNSENSVIKEFENKYKRALADYQNLEKRIREEKSSWIISANKQLLLKLLPILDTLMLASKHSQDQSLQISVSQFLDILKNEGVARIETKDKEFDPHKMEVINTAAVDPSAGSGQENKVVEELRAGFTLGDQVLRPAQVTVGSAKQN